MSGPEVSLVTGAGGFIGRRLVKALHATGQEVRPWVRADGDLRDRDAIRAALTRINPAHIYHLASVLPTPSGNSWQVIADEQMMLANLAYAMPSHCRLIYAGSMAEYGRSGVLAEQDQCMPDTAYGCAKFSTTTLALSLRSLLHLDICVARLFGVYGPGEASNRLLPTLISKLGRGEPVLLSDAKQIRDFVHVDDVCSTLIAFARRSNLDAPVISNIGTGEGVTVRNVCERVAKILRADTDLLQFGAIPRRTVDQDCLIANIEQMVTFANPLQQRWHDDHMSEEIVRMMDNHCDP